MNLSLHMDTVRWGILSTAKIGINKVIPSIQQAPNCSVDAIASRSADRARQAADKLNIPRWYGSYEDLLTDPEIDVIYNPLPNHLHVPQSLRALENDKHVLCEKPIAMDAEEAEKLLDAVHEYPHLKVMEAFMYRFHPQWIKAKSMVKDGKIGKLQTIDTFFSYYKDDPNDIRNIAKMGGGGLMDIGCYCISLSRYLFDTEPQKVTGQWKIDPEFNTDYLASGMLDFGTGTSTFTCATKTAPQQEVNIVGTKGRIVIDIPFNAPLAKQTILLYFKDGEKRKITIEAANQYMLQAQEFANSILEDTPPPTPLKDAVLNMYVIDAFRENAKTDQQ